MGAFRSNPWQILTPLTPLTPLISKPYSANSTHFTALISNPYAPHKRHSLNSKHFTAPIPDPRSPIPDPRSLHDLNLQTLSPSLYPDPKSFTTPIIPLQPKT
jgi:hypothetical protein